MVFSTLPPTEADGARVLECYRLRWQIELTFKRLKSILQLGHVPKQDDASSRAWLYAKLLVALLAERLTRVGSAISPWGVLLGRSLPEFLAAGASLTSRFITFSNRSQPPVALREVVGQWNQITSDLK